MYKLDHFINQRHVIVLEYTFYSIISFTTCYIDFLFEKNYIFSQIYIYLDIYIYIYYHKQRSSFARIICGFPGDKYKGFPLTSVKFSLIVPWEE